MAFRLRSYLPKSLYGRAALILIVPIASIQLLVSVAFIQRHFEGVTEQMTSGLVLELALLEDTVQQKGRAAAIELATALDMQLNFEVFGRVVDRREFFDFSGMVVQREIYEGLDRVEGVDLVTFRREVLLRMGEGAGRMDVRVSRSRVSASNPHQLLVLMVVAGVVLSIIAYLFLRNQLRPITRLAEAADAFGKGRNYPYRPRGAQEVRAAGAAFLAMRNRIERHIEQRTLMLSGVSHDLRTPLTRMRLELSMLEPSPEVDALLEDLSEMQRMLDAFLAFARGDATEEPVEVDANHLISGVVARAQRSGLNVVMRPSEAAPPITLRADAVARAVENLVNNAARYADRAEVSLTWGASTLVVSVEDDGPGIPPELREEATRPFSRLDSARNANNGSGVGLGLAIVADIARSHGGMLRLSESESLGGLRADLILAR